MGQENKGYVHFGKPDATIEVSDDNLNENFSETASRVKDRSLLAKKEILFYPSSMEALNEAADISIQEIDDLELDMKKIDGKSSDYKEKMLEYNKKVNNMNLLLRELNYLRFYAIDTSFGASNDYGGTPKGVFSNNGKGDYSNFLSEIEGFIKKVEKNTIEPGWMIEKRGFTYNIDDAVKHFDLSKEDQHKLIMMQLYQLNSKDASIEEFGGFSREGNFFLNKEVYNEWSKNGFSDRVK